jgi:electron-transferring-flavoprotein dehydrogenase
MEFDIVIVGAGPAGLCAAIRAKQKAAELGRDVSVIVIEKGSEVGAHILSGAVVDPIAIDRLLPGSREEDGTPFGTPVREDRIYIMSDKAAWKMPNWALPRLMSNHGNFIVSLGNVCRWLANKAEALGVEIYPGFAASEILYDEGGRVVGVATADMGVTRSGERGPNFQRGMALYGKYTLLAEGARGSLAQQIISKFHLAEDCDTAKYGIGLKELWQVDPARHTPGLVQHSFGWPLDRRTGGGSFLYHFEENLVAVGFVVHLNYTNPYLSPFEEFQRFKTHPAIRRTFEGGKRLAYGARAITEGGWQSVPKLVFPGGALIGCSAGFVNVPRIKGSHNAMFSGMQAAEAAVAALDKGRQHDELTDYERGWRASDIGHDLRKVRNVKPLWSKFGTGLGVILGGFDMWTNELFGFSAFGTLRHGKPDSACLQPKASHAPIAYPKPDGKLTFDRLSSVFLSNTHHEEDQPIHLNVNDPALQRRSELEIFAGPSTRYCPAGVYEWLQDNPNAPKYVINAANCVHCKTCDIKDPNQNITWMPPQGGDGPNYPNM